MAKNSNAASVERLAEKKRQAKRLCWGLEVTYPDAVCALHHDNPFQLLVATILSAQCTDVRVNATTPALFARFPTPEALAASTQNEVEEIVKPLGFFRNKAENIRGMARALVERFDGELPRTLDEMTSLPGVGRKTANVVLGTAFGLPTGVVVDTHVKRLTYLFGLTESTNVEKIERELMAILPRDEWINYSHRAIHHGRQICIARRPRCGVCPLIADCNRTGLPPLDGDS
jgi:endonuclease-3